MPDGGALPRTLCALTIGINWFDSGSGGLDRVFHDLTRALPAAGVDIRGLVVGPPDTAVRSGGAVRPFGGGSLPHRLLCARHAIAGAARDADVDLVASHFALFGLAALDCLGDLPLVVHFHGPWADESAAEGAGAVSVAIKRLVERRVYRRAARVIVLSQAFADLVVSRYGVSAARVRVVPGSVDLERFADLPTRRDARARLGWPQDRRILLSVRRLTRRMGLDRLIDAMPSVVRAVPDALLLIAGRGHMEAALRAQVTALGLEDHVRLLGFVPEQDLPVAYRAAVVNVVPTQALEGFGLTAAEALAAGTPSIVAPVGGLPEVVGGLSPDLVFSQGTPAGMADQLVAALRGDLALPDESACQMFAARHFAPALAAARTARVYREAA